MNIKLIGTRILVKRFAQQEIASKEGKKFDVVEVVKNEENVGEVVAKSEYSSGSTSGFFDSIKVGDLAYFLEGQGEWVKIDGKDYKILYVSSDKDSEVIAIKSQ